MTDYTLNPIPDSGGLYTLPDSGLEHIASLCLASQGGAPDRAKAPSTPSERENLWRLLNETMAETAALADGANASLARLESALGLATTSTEPQHPADVERRRIAARHVARAKCRALLERGYQP